MVFSLSSWVKSKKVEVVNRCVAHLVSQMKAFINWILFIHHNGMIPWSIRAWLPWADIVEARILKALALDINVICGFAQLSLIVQTLVYEDWVSAVWSDFIDSAGNISTTPTTVITLWFKCCQTDWLVKMGDIIFFQLNPTHFKPDTDNAFMYNSREKDDWEKKGFRAFEGLFLPHS